MVSLGKTLAWVVQGTQSYPVDLRSVAFSGGTAYSKQPFDVGELLRMRVEDEGETVVLCVQITSCTGTFISFRLYGTSGEPKKVWEGFVGRVKRA